jgi:hypothetical protein
MTDINTEFDTTDFNDLSKYSTEDLNRRILARRSAIEILIEQQGHSYSDLSYWCCVSRKNELKVEIKLMNIEKERRIQ